MAATSGSSRAEGQAVWREKQTGERPIPNARGAAWPLGLPGTAFSSEGRTSIRVNKMKLNKEMAQLRA
jgi:hypothetical protein